MLKVRFRFYQGNFMKGVVQTIIFSFFALLSLSIYSQEAQELSEDDKQYVAWAKSVMEKLKPQTGNIQLPNGVAELEVPEDYYYLDPAQAEIVLSEVWGNPPGQPTLGILFPAGKTPFDPDAWAVTIEYENEGHVEDDDAAEIDYDDLLSSMKDDTRASNQYRVEQGYPPVELVGWAARPYYDQQAHKLHWAKEIKFGESQDNTLNYNIRVLGREGVLVLNFIAGMNQLSEINQRLNSVLQIANFKEGHKYSDFDPSVDKVAAYGLGALVAGKVLAKTGFLATALLMLKKFWFLIVIGFGVLLNGIKSVFGKKSEQDA